MPIARRHELLNWAYAQQAFLIEDDYDSDYSYGTNPVPALQSIDEGGRVIYMGTFSKTLSPSLHMGYLVLPPALLRQYEARMARYTCAVSWIDQRIVAKLIAGGHYHRQVRRLRTRFKQNHDLLVRELQQLDLRIIGQGSGLTLLLELPGDKNRPWLMERAREQGVRVYSPEDFWQDKGHCPPNLVLIGFTSIALEEIPACIQRLKAAWF